MALPDYVQQSLAQRDKPGLPDYVIQSLEGGKTKVIEAPIAPPQPAPIASEFPSDYFNQPIPFAKIGQAIQGAADYVTEPLPVPKSAGEFLAQNVPQSIARFPAAIATGIGGMAYDAAKEFTDPVYNALTGRQDLGEAFYDFYHAPETAAIKTAKGLAEFTAAPLGLLGKQRAKEAWSDPVMALAAISPLGKGIRKGGKALLPEPSSSNLLGKQQKAITKGFNQAIKRPGKVLSRKALAELEVEQAGAIKAITKDKDYLKFRDEFGEVSKGRLPKTLDEMSQSIFQVKIREIEKANVKNREAGEAGYKVPLDSAVVELQKIVDDVVYQKEAKQMVKYAEEKLKDYKDLDGYTPEQAQRAMIKFNEGFKVAKASPSRKNFAKAKVDALVGNHLRQSLNQVVEAATGPGYAEARKTWGQLKSIEEPVATKLKRFNQQTGGTTFNFYDVFAANDLIHGVLTGGKLPILKGLGLAATSLAIRMGKNPNRAVKKMFQEVDKIERRLKELVPEAEAAKIVAEIEPKLQAENPTLQIEGRGNQLALPAPVDPTIRLPGPEPNFRKPTSLDKLFRIAQSLEGKQLLKERLGREEKHTKLLTELLKIPKLKALPPGGGFTRQNPIGPEIRPKATGQEVRRENQFINNLGQ